MTAVLTERHSSSVPSEPVAFVEVHYYDGGLRTAAITHDGIRPTWAPSADLVGFRDEFDLSLGDWAVEFARFQVNGRALTWLGIFGKDVDKTFGDRRNHAGIGVWLLNQNIADAEKLLYGLRQLASANLPDEIEKVEDGAKKFLSQDYLPAYLLDGEAFELILPGWPFSPSPLPETALYIADGSTAEDRWRSVARQITRMCFLPDQATQTSRALILVEAEGHSFQERDRSIFKLIRGRMTADLLAELPRSVQKLADDHHSQKLDIERNRAEIEEVGRKLVEAESQTRQWKLRAEELEQKVAESDLLTRLLRVDDGIALLNRRSETISADLSKLTVLLARETSRMNAQGAVSPAPPSLARSPAPRGAGRSGNQKGSDGVIVIILLVLLLIVIVGGVAYFVVN